MPRIPQTRPPFGKRPSQAWLSPHKFSRFCSPPPAAHPPEQGSTAAFWRTRPNRNFTQPRMQLDHQTDPVRRGGGGNAHDSTAAQAPRAGTAGKGLHTKNVCSRLGFAAPQRAGSSKRHCGHQAACAQQTAGEMPSARGSGLAFCG